MFPDSVETERIRHERLCHENIGTRELYRICADDDEIDEITRFMPWRPHNTVRESKEFIDRNERKWDDGESIAYIIRPKPPEEEAGEFAGLTGLKFDWDRQTVVEWIWLRKPYWGRGYNGESARAMMKLVFEHLDLDLFAVTHAKENDQSRRAIEKYIDAVGGQRDGLLRNWISHQDHISDEVRYTVTRDQWRSCEQ